LKLFTKSLRETGEVVTLPIGLTAAVLLWTALSSADPIVFDFEDGLQGWELHGSAQRVQTQMLDGEWAIFGDGVVHDGTAIFTEIDLTPVASICIEQFYAGDTASEDHFLMIGLYPVADPFAGASFDLTDSPDPFASPGIRTFALNRSARFPFKGAHIVSVLWGRRWEQFYPEGLPPDLYLGFIDNITFHPIPEPAHLDLAGLLGVLGLRWVMGRFHLDSRKAVQ
jgi:hypothetical protein